MKRFLVGAVLPLLVFLFALAQLLRDVLPRMGAAEIALQYERFFSYFPPFHDWRWWALCALIGSVWFLRGTRRKKRDRMLELKTDTNQPLKIREAAINQYVHDDLNRLPFVKTAEVQAKAVSGTLVIQARIWITSTDPLENVQKTVLARVYEACEGGLGITRIGDVDLYFESVRMTRKQARDRKRAAEAYRRRLPAPKAPPEKQHDPEKPTFQPYQPASKEQPPAAGQENPEPKEGDDAESGDNFFLLQPQEEEAPVREKQEPEETHTFEIVDDVTDQEKKNKEESDS